MPHDSDQQQPDPPEPVEGGSFMHMLPIYVPRPCTIEGLVAAVLPWGAPSLAGAAGVAQEPSGMPLLGINFEWPLSWLHDAQPLSKRDREAIHLRRFATDHLVATGSLACGRIGQGDDPPDFIVETADGLANLDCTAFTVAERREVVALFTEVRRRIAAAPHPQFAHLAGYTIYIWFREEGQPARPFRRNDHAAADELMEALANYRPDPRQLQVATGRLPEQAPDLGAVTTLAGATFYAVPFTNAAPGTGFYAWTGFELGLAYTTWHDPPNAWGEIDRLVAAHDQPKLDWLLISVGAPNQHGQLFPSEEALMRFLLNHPQPLPTPQHISRVTLHSWQTGEAVELLPEPTPLFGQLYQGHAVPHHPLQPPSTTPTSETVETP
jgi:hypothetical protein